MKDYTKWIGKQVYVSDKSQEDANKGGFDDDVRIFVGYRNGSRYPVCTDRAKDGIRGAWTFVALAEPKRKRKDLEAENAELRVKLALVEADLKTALGHLSGNGDE